MSARRIRKHRAAVRRANHRAESMHGKRDWIGDAFVITSSCYGAVWCRDTRIRSGGPARAGFILTRHKDAR